MRSPCDFDGRVKSACYGPFSCSSFYDRFFYKLLSDNYLRSYPNRRLTNNKLDCLMTVPLRFMYPLPAQGNGKVIKQKDNHSVVDSH